MYNLPEPDNDIHDFRTSRELPGHRDFFTTMIYMYMLIKGWEGCGKPRRQDTRLRPLG
jgi:hypothetical protein